MSDSGALDTSVPALSSRAVSPASRRSAGAGRGRRMLTPRMVVSTAAVIVYIAIWQLVVTYKIIDPSLFCGPWAVLKAGGRLIESGELWSNAKLTVWHFGLGYVVALIGIPTGFLMGRISWVREVLDPIVTSGYCTPAVAVLPVLVAWFGVGTAEQAIIVFFEASIPIIINSMAGVKDVDPLLIRAAKSFCVSRRDLFLKVFLPGSVPSVVTGMRIGISRGLLAVIIAELFASPGGIGSLMGTYGQTFDMAPVFFLVLLVAVVVYLLTRLLGVLEGHLNSWRSR
jgi:NitT/TauT family transport system permease protein